MLDDRPLGDNNEAPPSQVLSPLWISECVCLC